MALKRPVETSQARGLAGHALRRPALHRRRERLLQRLLGQIEVAEQADERGQDAAGFGAVESVYECESRVTRRRGRHCSAGRLLGRGSPSLALIDCDSTAHACALRPSLRASAEKSTTGRTSMPPSRAEGILAATWMASFRSLASIR